MEREKFITFLNLMEGLKIRIKEKHWTSKNINNHRELDDLYWNLSRFEDAFAEEGIIVFGEIQPGEIKAVELDSNIDIIDACLKMTDKLHLLCGTLECAGILSEVDGFIHELNTAKYLAKMTVVE
ncbi:hypothetical protein M0Q97_07220 [Candidatus Dojkabacteria bacterium]|jgi:hypothetical protein|nr:hypothetical protein [Candidatus Dojkabacteria bacterium]